jgi:hypothetical protein
VEAFAGTPQRIANANFQTTVNGDSSPTVRFFGYGCHPMAGSYTGGIDCRTAYYFASASGGPLEAFKTASPSFHTQNGTTPGMTAGRATHLEGQNAVAGCVNGIIRSGGADLLIGLTGSTTGTVDGLSLESTTHAVGLESC